MTNKGSKNMRLRVLIEQDIEQDEDGMYVVECPSLP